MKYLIYRKNIKWKTLTCFLTFFIACNAFQVQAQFNEKNLILKLNKVADSLTMNLKPWKVPSSIFKVEDFGAISDGQTINTVAIQNAIDKCAASGGGTVLFSKGDYVTGTIELRSNTMLEIAKGARILGSTNLKDYPDKVESFKSVMSEVHHYRISLIYAEKLTNIGIRGEGEIYFRGERTNFPGPETIGSIEGRPFGIRMIECKNITLQNISLKNSAAWMQSYLYCENLIFEKIKVFNHANFNNDGLDTDGCKNVIVRNCFINSEDDAMCLKGASMKPTENMLIENSTFISTCNALKIGTDTQGDFKDIIARNLVLGGIPDTLESMKGHEASTGITLVTVDGGHVENIFVSNVVINQSRCPIFLRIGNRGRVMPRVQKPLPGNLKNIIIKDIKGSNNLRQGSFISGIKGYPIENVIIRNMDVKMQGGGTLEMANSLVSDDENSYPDAHSFSKNGLPSYGFYIRYAKNVLLKKVKITPQVEDKRPMFMFASIADAQTALNIADFQTPSQSSKVHTWWHWMDGNITKEGLTKDLEAMKKQGIVEASIFNIGKNYSKEVDISPKIKFNSPEWIDMYQWALKEANRLGITIGIQTIDGYGTTGGPWITPEFSMKQYVWTKTAVEGGKDVNIKLEQPLVVKNFYRDVAVVAYPLSIKPNSFQNAQPKIEVNKGVSDNGVLADGNPKTEINFKKGDVIDIRLNSELSVNKLAIFPHLPFCWDDMGKILVQFTISSSDDGKKYTKIADVDMVGVNKPITASFPETKAKYFRLELSKTNFMYFSTYPIAELEILKGEEIPTFVPPLTSFLEKVASVFDVKENVHDVNINTPKTAVSENSTVDISSFMSADGTLNWKAPKGNWQIIRFGYTSTGVMNDPPTPEGTGLEADKMDTTALSLHFNSYAKKLIDAAGKYKGNTLKFVLLDSWEAEFQTWSKTFPTEFKNRRGYDILSWIPVLCGETMGNTQLSEAFLHDFRKTIAELIDQNYYKHFSNLCHRNGLEFHAEGIYSNWGGYPPLDPLKANQYFDVPMTEFWSENDANGLGKYKPANRPSTGFPTSSALAYDKQIIACESYTNMAHYSEAPADLKPFGDAAYCSGVNQLILHSFVHQPFDKKPGMTLGKFGAHFNRNNPIWAFNQDWLTYQARVQYVLQKGTPVADIVFFAGDQLPQFFSKNFVNDLPFGYQATACNIDMLKNKATVIGGKINFGGKQSYAVLMLQNSTKMEFATLKKIAELVKNGAVIYGPKPLEMLSVSEIKNDETTFKQLADALWGNALGNNYGKGKVIFGKPIGEVLSQNSEIPDLTTNTNDPKDIMYIHRKLGNEDVYFVFNQQNRDINREILFRLKDKTPEIWNPENGTVTRPAIYSIEKNQTRIPVSFKPYESKIFVFKNEVPKQFIPQVSLAGTEIFPNKQLSDTTLMMPQAVFTNGKLTAISPSMGEYVFKSKDNKVIKKKLEQPKTLNLGNSKTKIEFFPISDEIIQPIEVSELTSLTEFENPAIKYFTGKVKYTMNFSVPNDFMGTKDSLVLELGNLGATAEVILNGQLLAHPWHPNTFLNVSGLLKAKNTLEITVANECRNRFIGDLVQYGSLKSLWTTSPVETLLNKDMPLKPSGLMSPLRLIGYKKD